MGSPPYAGEALAYLRGLVEAAGFPGFFRPNVDINPGGCTQDDEGSVRQEAELKHAEAGLARGD